MGAHHPLRAQETATTPSRANPEAASPSGADRAVPDKTVTSRASLAVTANEYATRAAFQILSAGGSAVDAAIAAQLVLSIVEPQSSGLGGGGFALVHDPARGTHPIAYDGRETAPLAAKPTRFMGANGKPLGFIAAAKSWRSVGTPGLPFLLATLHTAHGKLAWADLFQPAINIARGGFAVSPRLNALLSWMGAARFADTARARYFSASGTPLPVGTVLRSPEFADTLERFARQGPQAFRSGPIVQAILAAVAPPGRLETAHPMQLRDFATYAVKRRTALCAALAGQLRVCGMPPPSSGGSTVLQALLISQAAKPKSGQQAEADRTHRRLEAANLAFADRNHFIGDPDLVTIPLAGLLDAGYTSTRAQLIAVDKAQAPFSHGRPPGWSRELGADGDGDSPGTTHLSVVDRDGMGIAMTTSIETAFGAGISAAGMLLNNQLTDFSFDPVDAQGKPRANRVQAGKRPRSSMAPTLIYKDDRLHAVLGSPGGSRIIGYVTRAVEGLVLEGLGPQTVAQRAHVLARNGPAELEQGSSLDSLASALRARGHKVRRAQMTSGLHIIARGADGSWQAGVDPRREGSARSAP